MSERKKVDKPNLQGRDPTLAFYMAVSVGNLDGSIDDFNEGAGEGVEGLCETLDEAVQILKDLNDEHPTCEGYVFHCVPVKRVWRGKVRVSPVKPGSLEPQRQQATEE